MASDPLSTSKKKNLKFLCSYGGEILPRPRDRKLRYVGGVMRIIQIRPDCSWEEFRQQMEATYGKPHTIKYQLPGLGEDFHRLLSVSDDEELEDMMEYGVVDGGGSQKLIRLFLFPLDKDVDAHLSLTLEGDSTAQYLSAVNGVAMENRASRGFHSEPSNSRSRAAPRTQRSGPAALEDGLIEFEKEVKHAKLVARSSKSMLVQNPSLGESISEYSESGFEDDEERIIDTAVGKIDLRHMQEMSNKDLKAVKVLGSGGFGTVYHGKWKGKDVAIKRINKSCFPGRQSEKEIVILETFKEAGILSKLQHPNIVSLYGFTQDESGSSISIVMELVLAGSLRNILDREDKFLDHRKRLLIARGAASGMDYLHLRKVVHFDLKCDNLLVNLEDPSRPVCKVTDFGLSKVKQNTLISGGFRGTLPYMAPELLRRGKNKVSEKVDVYSFGIVMWEILTGGMPYDGMGPGDIMAGVPDNTLRPPVPASCDPQWRRLMEQCWDCDPKLRPSFNEIARRLNFMLLARS